MLQYKPRLIILDKDGTLGDASKGLKKYAQSMTDFITDYVRE
ncbi:hypothetical protein TrRE_jg10497, partial [Triparma retinervis]